MAGMQELDLVPGEDAPENLRLLPDRVPEEFVVPPEISHLDINYELATHHGYAGCYINLTLELMANGFDDLSPQVIGAKAQIFINMLLTQQLLNLAGEQAFQVPKVLVEVFQFLDLEWPPVIEEDGEEDEGIAEDDAEEAE